MSTRLSFPTLITTLSSVATFPFSFAIFHFPTTPPSVTVAVAVASYTWIARRRRRCVRICLVCPCSAFASFKLLRVSHVAPRSLYSSFRFVSFSTMPKAVKKETSILFSSSSTSTTIFYPTPRRISHTSQQYYYTCIARCFEKKKTKTRNTFVRRYIRRHSCHPFFFDTTTSFPLHLFYKYTAILKLACWCKLRTSLYRSNGTACITNVVGSTAELKLFAIPRPGTFAARAPARQLFQTMRQPAWKKVQKNLDYDVVIVAVIHQHR